MTFWATPVYTMAFWGIQVILIILVALCLSGILPVPTKTTVTDEKESTQGPQGPQGLQGTNGTDGTDGTNGTNGTNGTTGAGTTSIPCYVYEYPMLLNVCENRQDTYTLGVLPDGISVIFENSRIKILNSDKSPICYGTVPAPDGLTAQYVYDIIDSTTWVETLSSASRLSEAPVTKWRLASWKYE